MGCLMQSRRVALWMVLALAAGSAGLAVSADAGQSRQSEVRPATISLRIADWLPTWDKATGGWGLVPAGTTAPSKWTAFGTGALSVPPGRYDIYWQEKKDAFIVLVAANFEAAPGTSTTIPVNTGLRLSVADWARLDPTAVWLAMKPGERTGANQTAGNVMILSPGSYDLYWRGGGETIFGWVGRMDISPPYASLGIGVQAQPEGLKVTQIIAGGSGEKAGIKVGDVIATIDGRNVIGMDTAPAVAILRGPPSSTVKLTMVGASAPVSITRDAQPTIPSLSLDSGVRLKLAAGQPAGFDAKAGGWWGAYFEGTKEPAKTTPINRSWNAAQPMTLTPATYDIYVRKDDKSDPVLVQKSVVIERGKIAEVVVPR